MSEHPVAAAYAGILLFVVGLVVGVGTFELNRRERQALGGWLHTEGTVVELMQSAPGAAGHPVVSFTTPAGDRIRFTPPRTGTVRQYVMDEQVPVVYDPDRPIEARIDPRTTRWTRNALATGASLILLCLGGYVAWFASRWRAPDRIA